MIWEYVVDKSLVGRAFYFTVVVFRSSVLLHSLGVAYEGTVVCVCVRARAGAYRYVYHRIRM